MNSMPGGHTASRGITWLPIKSKGFWRTDSSLESCGISLIGFVWFLFLFIYFFQEQARLLYIFQVILEIVYDDCLSSAFRPYNIDMWSFSLFVLNKEVRMTRNLTGFVTCYSSCQLGTPPGQWPPKWPHTAHGSAEYGQKAEQESTRKLSTHNHWNFAICYPI